MQNKYDIVLNGLRGSEYELKKYENVSRLFDSLNEQDFKASYEKYI